MQTLFVVWTVAVHVFAVVVAVLHQLARKARDLHIAKVGELSLHSDHKGLLELHNRPRAENDQFRPLTCAAKVRSKKK